MIYNVNIRSHRSIYY